MKQQYERYADQNDEPLQKNNFMKQNLDSNSTDAPQLTNIQLTNFQTYEQRELHVQTVR